MSKQSKPATQEILLAKNIKRKSELTIQIKEIHSSIFEIIDQLDADYRVLSNLRTDMKDIREDYTLLDGKDGSIFKSVLNDSLCLEVRNTFCKLISVSHLFLPFT